MQWIGKSSVDKARRLAVWRLWRLRNGHVARSSFGEYDFLGVRGRRQWVASRPENARGLIIGASAQ